ncbi:Spore protein SP21 [Stieleria maiorica]|uniref:Spore protein SP21 n=2 Tax=Stieleria maiorica TaxID=2795974 RepID=A0A5B9MQV9_9BACT|nr:Spore protein SP21 [Stieleria maiorica]
MSTTMTTTKHNPKNGNGDSPSVHSGNGEETYQATFSPRFDIWEGDDELVLYGDLPGVDPDSLDIAFENRQLTIHGKVCNRHDDDRMLYSEYGVGDFHRTFTIGEAIDSERINAELHDGVLTLHLPKSEQAKPRRIKVTAN